MSKRVANVRNIRTIKAYRGESLTIHLGKSFPNGTLTAWMKKDPNSETYRSFEIIGDNTIKLSAENASDYTDGVGNVTEAVEGRWYFDVEFLPDGVDQESETVVDGTILFINDITNSAGYEVTNPNTGNNVFENVSVTTETHLNNILEVGTFNWDLDDTMLSDLTFSWGINPNEQVNTFIGTLIGTTIKVLKKHQGSKGFYYLVQQITEGTSGRMWQRGYSSRENWWSEWSAVTENLKYIPVYSSRNFTNDDIGKVLVVQNSGVTLTMPTSGILENFNCCVRSLTGFSSNLTGFVDWHAVNGLSIDEDEMISIGRLGNKYIVTP